MYTAVLWFASPGPYHQQSTESSRLLAASPMLFSLPQSTFMQLVETEMLLTSALEQLDAWEQGEGELHMRYKAILAKHKDPKQQLSDADLQALQALASPRLLTVWFNSW